MVMEVQDIQINTDVPEDIFKPSLKKGTVVRDRRTGETYTVEQTQ